jgi:shikimate kinase/3-dehydroquinate synthase
MDEAGPGLVLVGLSGSGKTTVGRLVAERLGRPFRDTDELIARRTGVPAAAYLSERGQRAFRAVEREAIDEACAVPASVIASGGGALNDPLNRWRLWSHGRTVWLRAPEEMLLTRLARDVTPRPLLAASPAERLGALADERAPFYRAADVMLDAELDPETVADAVLRAIELPVPTGRRLYDGEEPRHHPIGPERARIVFGHEAGDGLLRQLLADLDGTPSLVLDRRVAHLAPGSLRRIAIPGGEPAKRIRRLERVLSWLAEQGAERGDPVISLGGGTVGDVAGLAAALYARGVPYVAVPTTWLAQADAALGGKVGIDLRQAKNVVGAFWPPWAVVADTALLRSLPPARRRDGMAESIKAAIVGDADLWRLIADRGKAALRDDEEGRYAIIERAARVKLAIVRRDPFETGERRQLNLGHTLAHALEIESGFRLAHGAAVGLGLRAAATLAASRGGDASLAPALDDLLAALGFGLRRHFDPAAVRRALETDKKRTAGRQRWLLPVGVGQVVEADDVADSELDRALHAIHQAA